MTAHIGIPHIGAAAVDFQCLSVHLVSGLWRAGYGNAHRLRFSWGPETNGKLVKLRSGIVTVVPVDIGACFPECDRNCLQLSDQAGGNAIYTVKTSIPVLRICNDIAATLPEYGQRGLPSFVLQIHGLGRVRGQETVKRHR